MSEIYSNNAIYTRIRAAALAYDSGVFCTQTYAPVPAHFPTVFAREIGRFTPNNAASFSNTQNIHETTWEVQVHSNLQTGRKEQAYAIMDSVKATMQRLFFLEVMEQPIDSPAEGYYTLVTRFRRVIGSGETMPSE